MKQFKNLRVWSEAVEISVDLYSLTNKFPKSELFISVSQIRRAGLSIASNIAEGAGKRSDKDKCRMYEIAIASAFELETQLIITNRIGFIDDESFLQIQYRLDKIQSGLGALINYLTKAIAEKKMISRA